MLNIVYNLTNTFSLVLFSFFLIQAGPAFADDTGRVVATVKENEPRWYAVARVNDRKKLYVKGDIFCSERDITYCLRIKDIKNGLLVLEDPDSGKEVAVVAGKKVPLPGSDIVFQEAVQSDIVEYNYRKPEDKKVPGKKDFEVVDADGKIVLRRAYVGDLSLEPLTDREKELFASPVREGDETIDAELFKGIEITEAADGTRLVNLSGAEKALKNADRTLVSMIKKVKPVYRFGYGPRVDFNSELGNVSIQKEGFLIKNLAVAKLAEKAGIKKGDLIKSVNGHRVNSLFGLYRAYKSVRNNDKIKSVKLEIIREDRPETLIYRIR